MRLIDADALEKYLNNKIFGAAGKIKAWIDAQPTVDAVPVVRCKDCKHYIERTFLTECMKHDLVVEPNDFCSDGERREKNDQA